MPTNAAQYVRMSTDQQPLSIETQKAAIAAYAARHGLDVVRTYADEGKSGVTLAGRPAMQQLLKDVVERNRPFAVVLVLDVSRWGRFQDVDEGAYYEWHCRKHGVALEYVSEPFPGSDESPMNSIYKQLKRVMAGEYSRELAAKVRAGHIQVIEKGFAVGSQPCIGYRRQAVSSTGVIKGVLKPGERKPALTDRVRWVLGPPHEVEAVRRVFEEYKTGVPIVEIARRLGLEGMRSSHGTVLSALQIRSLLKSELVTGVFNWGARKGQRQSVTKIRPLAERVTNHMVPAVVDRQTWEEAQAKLNLAAWVHHFGTPREALLDELREALASDPRLRSQDFAKSGLRTAHVYKKQFGSLAQAYEAAGRTKGESDAGTFLARSATQRLRRRFLFDVMALGRAFGIPIKLRSRRSDLVVNGIEVRVKVARQLPSQREDRWLCSSLRPFQVHGSWLLILRLNNDGCTGKDFFLLPPEVHKNFAGTINMTTLPTLDPFRLSRAEELVDRLHQVDDSHT